MSRVVLTPPLATTVSWRPKINTTESVQSQKAKRCSRRVRNMFLCTFSLLALAQSCAIKNEQVFYL